MAHVSRSGFRTALAGGLALLAAFPAAAAGPFQSAPSGGMFPFFQQGGPGFSESDGPQGPFGNGRFDGERGLPSGQGDHPRTNSAAFPMAEGGPAGEFGGPPLPSRGRFGDGPDFGQNADPGPLPVIGFVAGLLGGAAMSQSSARSELEPWSADWYHYCANRYRTFDARTGTVLGSDGNRHFCSPS